MGILFTASPSQSQFVSVNLCFRAISPLFLSPHFFLCCVCQTKYKFLLQNVHKVFFYGMFFVKPQVLYKRDCIFLFVQQFFDELFLSAVSDCLTSFYCVLNFRLEPKST